MTNQTQTHIRIAAAGLVLGPLLLTVGDLLRRVVVPDGASSPAAITAAVRDHGTAWAIAGFLFTLAGFCLVPGAIALVLSAHGRGSRLTTIGGSMVAVGAVATAGHAVAFYSPYALYDRANVTAPVLTDLEHASEGYPLLVVLIVLFIVGMVLGPVVLFLGLRRAGRIPVWAVVAAVVFVVTAGTASVGAGVLGVLAATAAFVPAARSLIAAPSATPSTRAATAAPVAG